MKGRKHSKEAKRKISKSSKGNQYAKGYKHTKEAIEKIRNSATGRKHAKEYINKMKKRKGKNNPFFGKKHSKETKEKWSRSGKNNSMYGKKHTEKFKKEQSLRARKNFYKMLKKINKNYHPSYNINACKWFEQFDRIKNTIGKYATNGGEFYIKELGYWLDYINHELKIIIEWDEERHYRYNKLKKKDIKRQKEIEKHFPKYRFFRIRESEAILVEDFTKILK